jgi:glycerol-3-phosphate dehydrogenase
MLTIRAKSVLNAAGPYAERLLARGMGCSLSPPTHWSRDAFFVVAKPLIAGDQALALPSQTRDPDARLSRGGRHLFLTPWRGYTLVGVWHKVYQGPPDEFDVADEELEAFIAEINGAYAGLHLTLNDVSLWNAGLIPFGENDPAAKDLRFGHRSRIVDHKKEHGVDGLVTLIGVRFTTGPLEAISAVNLIFRKLGRKVPNSCLLATPLDGGDIENFEALVQEADSRGPPGTGPHAMRALAHNHGSAYNRVLQHVRQQPELGAKIGSFQVLKAEVVHAVREEMAQTLADVVLRRTDLGTGEYPGRIALKTCAELMAVELGWDHARITREVDDVVARYARNGRLGKENEPHSRSATCGVL